MYFISLKLAPYNFNIQTDVEITKQYLNKDILVLGKEGHSGLPSSPWKCPMIAKFPWQVGNVSFAIVLDKIYLMYFIYMICNVLIFNGLQLSEYREKEKFGHNCCRENI
jgi:hypothetical protein